ncbi:MAG: hypothetical protein ABIJ56_14090 [Pseudomonadota bacterium]
MKILIFIAALSAVQLLGACGSAHTGKLSAKFTQTLSTLPSVGLDVVSNGTEPWQKKRTRELKEKVRECLPGVLDGVCGSKGCRYAFSADELDASGPKHLLKVTIEYTRSNRFMDGYVIDVTYVMTDSLGSEGLVQYHYMREPESGAYYEEGMNKDELLTVDAGVTAPKFCEDLAGEIEELKKTKKKE